MSDNAGNCNWLLEKLHISYFSNVIVTKCPSLNLESSSRCLAPILRLKGNEERAPCQELEELVWEIVIKERQSNEECLVHIIATVSFFSLKS